MPKAHDTDYEIKIGWLQLHGENFKKTYFFTEMQTIYPHVGVCRRIEFAAGRSKRQFSDRLLGS